VGVIQSRAEGDLARMVIVQSGKRFVSGHAFRHAVTVLDC
jgi:hypothetical protein